MVTNKTKYYAELYLNDFFVKDKYNIIEIEELTEDIGEKYFFDFIVKYNNNDCQYIKLNNKAEIYSNNCKKYDEEFLKKSLKINDIYILKQLSFNEKFTNLKEIIFDEDNKLNLFNNFLIIYTDSKNIFENFLQDIRNAICHWNFYKNNDLIYIYSLSHKEKKIKFLLRLNNIRLLKKFIKDIEELNLYDEYY